ASRDGERRGFKRLVQLTRHEQCAARQAAAGALAELGDKGALAALRELESGSFDDETQAKDEVGSVLSQIGSSLGIGCSSKQAAQRAIAALERQ
ncbi:MAG: hypothetical protein ACK4N5_01440, partial [Myxococcales bacterium]